MGQAKVLLVGTDPDNPRGGIGFAIQGYRQALEDGGLLGGFVPSYNPHDTFRFVLPTLKAAPWMLAAIRRLKSQGVKPVVYSHAGGHLSIVRESALLALARRAGAHTMIQLHSTDVGHIVQDPFQRSVFRRALRSVDRVCVLLPYWARQVQEVGGIERVCVVPNPLPEHLEARARRVKTQSGSPRGLRILAMTRLVDGKGVDLAIEAMRYLDDEMRLIVAGDGPERRSLEEQARCLGVNERVEFLGWVAGDEKSRILEQADVFIAPTTYDAMPMAFLEAQAYGLPIVALRWGPVPDIVEDGETGLLVSGRDPEKLAAAVQSLGSDELRATMGRRAQERVLQTFSIRSVGERLAAVIP